MQIKKVSVLIVVLFGFKLSAQQNLKLWYSKPATAWEEALPIGNGPLGAMIFGGTEQERIQLNEETIWTGEPHNNVIDSHGPVISEIRKLLSEKKYAEAQALSREKIKANQNGMSYQPAGDLFLNFPGHAAVSNYYRDLNISNATSTVSYDVNGVHYTRTAFASFTDGVLVINCTASKPNSLNFNIAFGAIQKNSKSSVENGMLKLTGSPAPTEGLESKINFEALAKVVTKDGKISSNSESITISNATTATIFVSIGTNFKNYHDVSGDAHLKAANILKKASAKSTENLLKNHIGFYKKYFDRVSLDLGLSEVSKLPTDERIKNFNSQDDPQLVSLYFQFGRYLLISSSQPGGQAGNLQGKWNGNIKPAWDSKYTININTEMNYWPSELTNLSELGEPLFHLIKDLSETGKESASKLYNARGWMAHHNTDLWRITGPVDGGFYGVWPMGGAWLCRHLWEHYLYTGDKVFLKEIYPILKGSSTYFVDALQPEPDHGWLVVSPSMSPENKYMVDDKGNGVALTSGTTMDNQIVFELFSNTIKAAQVLNTDATFIDTVQKKKDQLPPMQIGQFGQLQEWMHDWDKQKDTHRHISHLFGLFPSNQISPLQSPELFAAAKNTLISRGDVSTGWSMGWKVNFWARMKDGDHAFKLISDQLNLIDPAVKSGQGGGTYANMFDAHPPFQIDGNFGCTAGIAEMLLQSQDGVIEILPALPLKWKDGQVKGLKARGGFIIDIDWKNYKITKLKIVSTLGGNCRLQIANELKSEDLNRFKLKPSSGENPNPFFSVDKIKKPLISEKAVLEKPLVKKYYSYDMPTVKGKTYEMAL